MGPKQLLFSHPDIGELYLDFKDVKLPDTIRDKLSSYDKAITFEFDPQYELSDKLADVNVEKPLFFEWQPIAVYFIPNANTQERYVFQINGQTVLHSHSIGKRNLISGEINLKNSVGLTRFSIQKDNQDIFFLITHIFPQKLDYQDDYGSMMLDISQIIYNLAYDYLNKTYTQARPKDYVSATTIEWVSIIKTIFTPFCQSIELILQQPHSEIKQTERIRPVDCIRKPNRKADKWLDKNPKYVHTEPDKGVYVAEGVWASHMVEQRKHISFDTYENRFVVWAINQIILKLDELIRFIKQLKLQEGVELQEVAYLKNLRQRLVPYLRNDAFREVSTFENQFNFSTVLTMAPGYKDFQQRFLLLQKGLSIRDNALFKLDLKDIATLYEYWCFLKTVSILQEDANYSLATSDLIKVEHNRLTVNLRKGRASKVSFRNASTNDLIELTFNRSFTKLPTYLQKPDILLEITKAGSDIPITYVLDAKYRFERKTDNIVEADKYGPPQDAIGQLHRYRDAIVKAEHNHYQKVIEGGLILFPYPENEELFRQHTFYKSYAKVVIGAVPFQPGSNRSNKLFREFLSKAVI